MGGRRDGCGGDIAFGSWMSAYTLDMRSEYSRFKVFKLSSWSSFIARGYGSDLQQEQKGSNSLFFP